MPSALRADVYVAPAIPVHSGEWSWSPTACTLVHGEQEAVLIDTPLTSAQTQDLVDWIKSIILNKRLTTIYITHGHGDHFFLAYPYCKSISQACVPLRLPQPFSI
jgi:glyoxylase-like metal-dependent hydrolase (beta-lactamase superfamily II)